MTVPLDVLVADVGAEDRAALVQRAPAGWRMEFRMGEHLDPADTACARAQVLCVFVRTAVTPELLASLPRLRLVVTRSAGTDHIDIAACRAAGIAVCNVPDYGAATVAEHTFALLLAVARHLVAAHERARRGSFAYRGLTGFELEGKVIGIAGLDRIGRHVARIANGFGMHVIAFDPALAENVDRPEGVSLVGWDELLERSDILTLHLPSTQHTHHLLGADAFARMKRGVVLINTARGALIDEAALSSALDAGTVSAAGLDVLEQEGSLSPEAPTGCGGLGCDAGWPPGGPLLAHPRVLVTPHVGFNTREAVDRILAETVNNIAAWQAGGRRHRVD